MDYSSIHSQFKSRLEDGALDEAIELIVPIIERPDIHQNSASMLINTLVFSALIPEQRFSESIAWLDDSIQGDFGYESWNSISNLGNVYLRLGQVEKAKSLFSTMLQAQTGPTDEATEFMNIISSGEAETLLANQPDPRENDAYIHLLAYLDKKGADQEMTEAFELSRGGAIHGFVQGVLSTDDIQKFNPTHDAIAQMLWDFLTEEHSNPVPTYTDSVVAIIGGYATKDHVRVVREMAFQGAPDAASHMYTFVSQNQGYAWPWLNVAIARGEQTGAAPVSRAVQPATPKGPRAIRRF